MLRVIVVGLILGFGCTYVEVVPIAESGDGDSTPDMGGADGDPGERLDMPSDPGDTGDTGDGELPDMPLGDGDGDGDGDTGDGDGDGDDEPGPICDEAIALTTFGNWDYYTVPVLGVMSDDNVAAACWSCNLEVPCAGLDSCEYTDDVCAQTGNEITCTPLIRLADHLCGTIPEGCESLFGSYQYMGHAYGGGSIGFENGSAVSGSFVSDEHALCVIDSQQ